jgi:isopenicillin-N epimerase
VDHITSSSALVLPLARIAEVCHRNGTEVLGDGAHAPGAIAVDIPSLGVDWYGANLHKWAWAPRSCGILWAPPERQDGLHPPVISWGLDQGFTAEFDLVGTRDPSAWLASPAGVAFLRALGIDEVRRWNHRLAWEGAQLLTDRWETELPVAEAAVGTMATIPLPARAGSTKAEACALRDALLFEDRIEVQIHDWRGRIWARISGQVYTDLGEVERLAERVLARI